jgi:F-type H+-transporting ATPase subunit b
MINTQLVSTLAETANNTEGIVPSIPTFIASIVGLFILVLVVSYFAYFPVRNFVRARKKYIKDNIDNSEKANRDAQKVLAKANEKLATSKSEGQKILKDYQEKASQEKNEILSSAKDQASKIIEDASKRIKADEEEMKNKLTDEISTIAMQAAEKLIKENISTDSNKKMVEEFIKELNK